MKLPYNYLLQKKRFIKMGHTCFGVSDVSSLTLTGADRHDSLVWSRKTESSTGTAHSWSPYGSGRPVAPSLPGFNGERIDPVSGSYHLGNGYRAYNPVLMRFNCPDSLSPFGAGGINPYAYCAGDPVNHTDPSGHISMWGILGIVTGVVGIAFAAFTAGASVALAGTVMGAISAASATSLVVGTLAVTGDVLGIAGALLEDTDPLLSSIFTYMSIPLVLPRLGLTAWKIFEEPGKLLGNIKNVFRPGNVEGLEKTSKYMRFSGHFDDIELEPLLNGPGKSIYKDTAVPIGKYSKLNSKSGISGYVKERFGIGPVSHNLDPTELHSTAYSGGTRYSSAQKIADYLESPYFIGKSYNTLNIPSGNSKERMKDKQFDIPYENLEGASDFFKMFNNQVKIF